MSHATDYDELTAKLSAAPDQTRYRLYFAALLASASRVPPDEFIVVGGSAIEIYTLGEYTSGDIDIVAANGGAVRAVLQSWRFKREGRGWWNDALSLFVDLVSYPYTGSFERTRRMETPYGAVRVAAIEDLLVKRLASVKFWKVKGDLEQAKLLALNLYDRIDWEYVERYARQQDVWDLAQDVREAVEKARAE